MACKASFELYHNFPKLADEAGFAFNTHRPRVHIEWNKIRLLDVESLIRERKFILLEQHINDILDCVLESEFDLRILDEGVIKIFRLAQLAVEYQQFCRHYLDRSVFVLREEITSLAQELEANKRNLREKEEEIRRIRRKSKQNMRPPIAYGNENIATLILNTLKNQSEIFPSATHLDTLQQNKCEICEKVFLNQLYLRSHILRRHPNATETPQKDTQPNLSEPLKSTENDNLLIEVADLKCKLKELETLITQNHKPNEIEEPIVNISSNIDIESDIPIKETKDAEVLTHGDVFEKMQEWKEQEFSIYKNELQLLKTQLISMINEKKEIENSNPPKVFNDSQIIEKLEMTIKQQGDELLKLKQDLAESKSIKLKMEEEKKEELQTQISSWAKKVEIQSNECKSLIQKLHEMAKDVQEYRAVAHAEKEKSCKLQQILDEQLKEAHNKARDDVKNSIVNKKPMADKMTLDKLQKKAKELLSMENISSSELSTSSEDSNNISNRNSNENCNKIQGDKKEDYRITHFNMNQTKNTTMSLGNVKDINPNDTKKNNITKKIKRKLKTVKSLPKENGLMSVPVSPIKVVRAKITEEVNQRLVQLGVDPLKNRLPKSTFQKQRNMLQKQQEVKEKKYPSREKIYHSIQVHLNANTKNVVENRSSDKQLRLDSVNKINRSFSISSVLSNVKTKALSLVKPNDIVKNINKDGTHYISSKSMKLSPTNHTDFSASAPHQPNLCKNKTKAKNSRPAAKFSTQKNIFTKRNMSSNDSDAESEDEINKSIDFATKSLDDIVKSPIRNPSETIDNKAMILEKSNKASLSKNNSMQDKSSDDVESLQETTPRKAFSEENLSPKQTKGVLKNASSTSSLNKKKVLFDMDAIQMKSVSATPSQSLAENGDGTDKYTLGIYNLDTEEWDPSSIENENPKRSTIQVSTRTSPKIAELKQAIESQMSRRIQTPSTVLAGSVDVLPIPLVRTSLGGSNTSLGSSILDDSENIPSQKRDQMKSTRENQSFKTKSFVEEDSEIDFSGLLAEDRSDKF